MHEIRSHGRRGQGPVASAELLAWAAISENAIARGACAFVCPAGAIGLEHENGAHSLSLWHRDVSIQHCVVCGRPIAPVAQLDLFAARTGIPRNELNICVDCRSTRVGDTGGDAVSEHESA